MLLLKQTTNGRTKNSTDSRNQTRTDTGQCPEESTLLLTFLFGCLHVVVEVLLGVVHSGNVRLLRTDSRQLIRCAQLQGSCRLFHLQRNLGLSQPSLGSGSNFRLCRDRLGISESRGCSSIANTGQIVLIRRCKRRSHLIGEIPSKVTHAGGSGKVRR